jgi:hypothetical protein
VYYEAAGRRLVDAHSLVYGTPTPDECQDWRLVSGAVEEGKLWVEAERALETNDLQDWSLRDDRELDGGNKVIAAWGDQPTISYHGADRAKGELTFFGDEEPIDRLAYVKSLPGVESLELRTDEFHIWTTQTFYWHMCIDLAETMGVDPSEAHHILAIEPLVDDKTREFVHHFVVEAFDTTVLTYSPTAGTT